MKRALPVVAILILTSSLSCKKLIEDKQRAVILDAMTNGVWIVEQYIENGLNITSDFLNYEFQFYENGKVNATLGTNVVNGTWEADVNKYTITSNFGAAVHPVPKLNATWLLTDSYWDYVEAETTTPSGKNILHLRKKS